MRDEIEKLDKSDQSSSLLDCLPFLECRRRCFQSTAAAIGKNKENHEIGRRCQGIYFVESISRYLLSQKMISAEAPVLFAKACEMFIIELTHRAWLHTEEGKRRTLQVALISKGISLITNRKTTLRPVLLILIFSIFSSTSFHERCTIRI